VTCEDDLTELHGDLARTRLELTRISDDNIANKTQLVESRKVVFYRFLRFYSLKNSRVYSML